MRVFSSFSRVRGIEVGELHLPRARCLRRPDQSQPLRLHSVQVLGRHLQNQVRVHGREVYSEPKVVADTFFCFQSFVIADPVTGTTGTLADGAPITTGSNLKHFSTVCGQALAPEYQAKPSATAPETRSASRRLATSARRSSAGTTPDSTVRKLFSAPLFASPVVLPPRSLPRFSDSGRVFVLLPPGDLFAQRERTIQAVGHQRCGIYNAI